MLMLGQYGRRWQERAQAPWRRWRHLTTTCSRRSSSASQILSSPLQCYTSTSGSPYLNLAFEHFLLQNAPPKSKILFFYVNKPSVVIGRNQNPWLETDLLQLHRNGVELVRRRSGGGAVFHDEGNINWSVICPSEDFTRDKHADMVVRGLKQLGVAGVRVNERHDIVLIPEAASEGRQVVYPEPDGAERPVERPQEPLKISGSAYKLTRGRALHHGTCLLEDTNLFTLGKMLQSPARSHIIAKGVESVRSPVGKVPIHRYDFEAAVQTEFKSMYETSYETIKQARCDERVLEDARVLRGFEELQTREWKFEQTPRFDLISDPRREIDGDSKCNLPHNWPANVHVSLHIRHAVIERAGIDLGDVGKKAVQSVLGYTIADAATSCGAKLKASEPNDPKVTAIAEWIDTMIPTPGILN